MSEGNERAHGIDAHVTRHRNCFTLSTSKRRRHPLRISKGNTTSNDKSGKKCIQFNIY